MRDVWSLEGVRRGRTGSGADGAANCVRESVRAKVAQTPRTGKTRPGGGRSMAAPKKDDLKAKFEAAAAAAKKTKKKPDNATLLKLYSYFKQASEGDVAGERPGGFDFVGGAKHDAWSKLKGMSKDDAMQNYIKQVEKLNRD
jgi:diazepam-binding inhibitor (GABA receptor modulating acyl-CoA-binding protein)